MRKLNLIINKETFLFYGLPGSAIIAVSFIVSYKVGNDFGGSTFANTISFLGCNVLLWQLYLLLFQYLPVDLMKVWQSKKKQTTDSAVKVETETDKLSADSVVKPEESPVVSIHPMTTEEYQSHCAEFERKKQEEHQNLVTPIMDYVGRVMAPFMEETELDKLRNEIWAWCDNPNHKPQPVILKTVHDNKDKLKTVSFKHFIWNIAVRLGFNNGYSIKVQAEFIKGLFPKELSDIEVKSLERSMTSLPDEGHIKLDRPKFTDNNVFHF